MNIRSIIVRLAFVLASCVAFIQTSAPAQSDRYRILLTNDDGIESPGIQVLAKALRQIGDVFVMAPCGERSGSSMSVSLAEELRVRQVERDDEALGQCVEASPAGAVLLAITTFAPEDGFDLVVSGINRGSNVGTLAHMSGTVGGAMMGAFYGIPAVAASLGGRGAGFEYAAEFVASFVEELKQRPALPGVVLSINVPKSSEAEIGGVTVAKMGGSYFSFAYQETQNDADGKTFQPRLGLYRGTYPEGSDTDAYMQDMITITPIAFDWTAYDVLDELRGWGLSHEIN